MLVLTESTWNIMGSVPILTTVLPVHLDGAVCVSITDTGLFLMQYCHSSLHTSGDHGWHP